MPSISRILAPALCAAALFVSAAGSVRAAPVVSPDAVLVSYGEALAKTPVPPAMEFQYVIEQAGVLGIAQVHHVYRQGPDERDETLGADGTTYSDPVVRVMHDHPDRYLISAVAPTPQAYAFTFERRYEVGNEAFYVFQTVPRIAGTYAVDRVTIGGRSWLPSTIEYHIVHGSVRGDGTLRFGPVGKYWLISEASIQTNVAGTPSIERIVWSKFTFPPSLPSATFSAAAPSETK